MWVCVCVSVSEGLPLCILDEVALLSFAADEELFPKLLPWPSTCLQNTRVSWWENTLVKTPDSMH